MQGSAKASLSSQAIAGPTGPQGPTGVGASFAIVTGQVDFGCNSGAPYGEDSDAVVTISAAGVTGTSKIVCGIDCTSATTDHGVDDAIVEGLIAYPQNLNAGVGFDCKVSAPNGTWGKYNVICYIY